jgi:hypothetical protein
MSDGMPDGTEMGSWRRGNTEWLYNEVSGLGGWRGRGSGGPQGRGGRGQDRGRGGLRGRGADRGQRGYGHSYGY